MRPIFAWAAWSLPFLLGHSVCRPMAAADEFYQPIPISREEFPKPARQLLEWMGCNPSLDPQTYCYGDPDGLSPMNVRTLRRHAWELFAAMTRPSRSTVTGQSRPLPIWQTWYPTDYVYARPTNGPVHGRKLADQLAIDIPSQLGPERAPALMARVYFNGDLTGSIRDPQHNYWDPAVLSKLIPDGKLDLPRESIAVKAAWMLAGQDACTEIGVWNHITHSTEEKGTSQDTWPDKARVEVKPGQCGSRAHVHRVSDFFNFRVTQKDIDERRIGFKDAKDGDYVLLVGLHFTTFELPRWVWATFWWHDRPGDGEFGADRPLSVRKEWRNYLMDVSYDMDRPHERDGSPKIAFNPYLEGPFTRGTVSNCMTCHARALWPGRPTVPVMNSFGAMDSQGIVVRGSDAATRTYYPKTDDFLKTEFLWSFGVCVAPTSNACGH